MPRISIDLIETDSEYKKLSMDTPVVAWLAADILVNKGVYTPVEITRDTKRIVDGRARLYVVKNVFKETYIEVTYVPEFSEEEIEHYTLSKYFVHKVLNKWEEAQFWDNYCTHMQLKEPEIFQALKPGRPSISRDKLTELGILTKGDIARAFNVSERTLSRHTYIYKNPTPQMQELAIADDWSPSVAEDYARLPEQFKEKIDKELTHKEKIQLKDALRQGIASVREVLGFGLKEKPKVRPKVRVGELIQPFPVVRTEHMDREVREFLRSKPEFLERDALGIKPIIIVNQKDEHYIVLQSIPTNEELTDGLEDGLYQLHKSLMDTPKYKGMYIQENKIVGEAKHVYINRDRVSERELIAIYLGTSRRNGYFD